MYNLQVNELDQSKISPCRFLRLHPNNYIGSYMSSTLEVYVKIPSETGEYFCEFYLKCTEM